MIPCLCRRYVYRNERSRSPNSIPYRSITIKHSFLLNFSSISPHIIRKYRKPYEKLLSHGLLSILITNTSTAVHETVLYTRMNPGANMNQGLEKLNYYLMIFIHEFPVWKNGFMWSTSKSECFHSKKPDHIHYFDEGGRV